MSSNTGLDTSELREELRTPKGPYSSPRIKNTRGSGKTFKSPMILDSEETTPQSVPRGERGARAANDDGVRRALQNALTEVQRLPIIYINMFYRN